MMSPPLKPAVAAGEPGVTSENFTPLIPSAKSGTEPNHGPYPEPDDAVTGPGEPAPCASTGATRTNSGRPFAFRMLSVISPTKPRSLAASAESILSQVSLGL